MRRESVPTAGKGLRGSRVWLRVLGLLATISLAGVWCLPGVAQANSSFSITGSMEGAIQIANGDSVSGGYNFSVSGAHPAMTVEMNDAHITFHGQCSNGGSDTLTVPLSAGPWHVAANDNSPQPTNVEDSPQSFMGSVIAQVCGGKGTLDASKGATFSATLQSDYTASSVAVQFHYRDPNAKGKGNYDCTAGTYSADICGASWSGTAQITPSSLPATRPSITTSATGSAHVGDTIRDSATLSGGSSPTGTLIWQLFRDSACTSQVYTTSVAVSGNGTYEMAQGYTPNNPGTYYWVASYTGDANNAAVSGPCHAANEQTVVSGPRSTKAVHVCRTPSGRKITFRGTQRPKACVAHPHRHHKHHRAPSAKPRRPSGFTG